MRNPLRSFSPVSLVAFAALVLTTGYLALIAVVMGYAALTVEFTQSVRNDESKIAELESAYLAAVSQVTSIDFAQAGYQKPIAESFVPTRSVTALR